VLAASCFILAFVVNFCATTFALVFLFLIILLLFIYIKKTQKKKKQKYTTLPSSQGRRGGDTRVAVPAPLKSQREAGSQRLRDTVIL